MAQQKLILCFVLSLLMFSCVSEKIDLNKTHRYCTFGADTPYHNDPDVCMITEETEVTYFSLEHPRVTYYNPKYLAYANLTTVRYGRANPIYYVGLNMEPLVPFDSNIYIDFYFCELLTNQYKRSFIEMHFDWCYMMEKDPFFGAGLKKGGLTAPCPHPPGVYNLSNMTINPAAIPKGFPFTRGRIVANFTRPKDKARVAEGYIDLKLTTVQGKNAKSLFNHDP